MDTSSRSATISQHLRRSRLYFIVSCALATGFVALLIWYFSSAFNRHAVELSSLRTAIEQEGEERRAAREKLANAFPLGSAVLIGDLATAGTVVRYERDELVILVPGSGVVTIKPTAVQRKP